MQEGAALKVTLKIRHTPEFTRATMQQMPDGHLDIHTERPLQGVAPGQFCVLYDEQQHRCLGSGEIRGRR